MLYSGVSKNSNSVLVITVKNYFCHARILYSKYDNFLYSISSTKDQSLAQSVPLGWVCTQGRGEGTTIKRQTLIGGWTGGGRSYWHEVSIKMFLVVNLNLVIHHTRTHLNITVHRREDTEYSDRKWVLFCQQANQLLICSTCKSQDGVLCQNRIVHSLISYVIYLNFNRMGLNLKTTTTKLVNKQYVRIYCTIPDVHI